MLRVTPPGSGRSGGNKPSDQDGPPSGGVPPGDRDAGEAFYDRMAQQDPERARKLRALFSANAGQVGRSDATAIRSLPPWLQNIRAAMDKFLISQDHLKDLVINSLQKKLRRDRPNSFL